MSSFFNDPATTEIYTLSLHDALPILGLEGPGRPLDQGVGFPRALRPAVLLLADARVTRRRSKAVLLLLPAAALGRRRQDNDADRPRRARGPSCAVDRPAEPRPHDPGERRRRV